MSTAKAKAKKQPVPGYATTGKNAAITVTFGIVFLTLGLCFLLAMMTAGEGYIARELAQGLNGLCGPVCVLFPLILMFIGVLMLVSARHRVNARSGMIAMALYLLVLTAVTLTARCGSVPGMSYLQYLADNQGWYGYGEFLQQAYKDGIAGSGGGLLGMLLAYPLWKMMGPILGMVFIVGIFAALLFVLFRKSPAELINRLSQSSEERQAARAQRHQEKEAERMAREAQRQAEEEQEKPPVVQQIPMQYPVQPRQVLQEDVYQQPQDLPPVQQQPAVQELDGFYPASSELYDERFPIHPVEKKRVYQQPAQQETMQPVQPVQRPVQPSADVAPVEKKESFTSRWQKRREEKQQEEQKPLRPATQPVQPVYEEPVYEEQVHAIETVPQQEELPWDVPQQEEVPVRKPRSQRYVKEVQTDLWQDEPQQETYEPAEVQTPAVAERKQEAWHVQQEEKQPAVLPEKPSRSWSDQVQQKQRELKMPEHTTAKGEPKPVYTDPVMPITGERVPIKPVPEPKRDAKLDGTRAPEAKQTVMSMQARYQPPPMRLLNTPVAVSAEDSRAEDNEKAEIIEGTLGSFGVDAEVKEIMHGPSITRFAIQIAPGVRVNRVTGTAENLALDLKTKHVRVETPIQGTSYIGIEVPNNITSMVTLREVLESEKMRNSTSPLLVALGKDVAGTPVLCDLAKMPHLLIAGATGSGKSVCINSIVCSILYRSSPEKVRLIMIDPKQVELTVYNSIPHLLVPVISDPRKAAGALAWVVQEMQERYGKFSDNGVRNLAGYNDLYAGTDKELPNIVVIIDEMADLMEVCRKDVEESIRRLAALARAAGIYMVLATQRPSVDVITGVVKNNIPSRIAFAVSSGTDSRTILDTYGAEKLMGKGDMLYKPTGSSPSRVQGCFVSDSEVNAITEYIGQRYTASYDPNIIEHLDNAEKEAPTADMIGGERPERNQEHDGVDDLLIEAIEMALEDGQISTSLLQRRLSIGYARAGRLVDEMEKRGIVGPSEGSKPRKTLITREQYYQMFEEQ